MAVVLAYMLLRQGIGLGEGFELVRRQRPNARPNPGFILQLLELEREVKGCTSLEPERVWCRCLYPPQRSTSCRCALKAVDD